MKRGKQPVNPVEEQVACPCHLDGERGVQNIGRRHALMDETGLIADLFGQFGGEGDDVVLGFPLDLVDPVDARVGIGLVALFPHDLGGVLGDHAQFGLRVAGMGLDLEPDAELVCGLPNGGHLGAGIARDHGNSVSDGKL